LILALSAYKLSSCRLPRAQGQPGVGGFLPEGLPMLRNRSLLALLAVAFSRWAIGRPPILQCRRCWHPLRDSVPIRASRFSPIAQNGDALMLT
jgi:hypothetical protein